MEDVARFFGNPKIAQQLQQQFSPAPPQLIIVRQTSPSEEKVSVNGITKSVHVVIKNTPFVLQLGLTNNVVFGQVIDFNHLALDVKLVYDNDLYKQVDFVKKKPVEFKSHVSERGDQITLECRLQVLTSQHEDMFFRVKVRAVDSRTQQDFNPPLEIMSQPIKSISKPEQLKKRPAPKKRSLNDVLIETVSRIAQRQEDQQKIIESLITERAIKRRRTGEGGSGVEAILPRRPAAATALLEGASPLDLTAASDTLSSGNENDDDDGNDTDSSTMTPATPPSANTPSAAAAAAPNSPPAASSVLVSNEPLKLPPQKQRMLEEASKRTPAIATPAGAPKPAGLLEKEKSPMSEFEAAFVSFMAAFNGLSPEERPMVVRRVIRTSSARETEKIAELLDLLCSEGMQRQIGTAGGFAGPGPCPCPNCPYRQELEKIDEFYRDILVTPQLLGATHDSAAASNSFAGLPVGM